MLSCFVVSSLVKEALALQRWKLMSYGPYRASHDTITNNLFEKGRRPDGHHDTLGDTAKITTNQIVQLNWHLLSLNLADADGIPGINIWLLNVTGIFDDGRLVFQPDFLSPRQIKSIGINLTVYL